MTKFVSYFFLFAGLQITAGTTVAQSTTEADTLTKVATSRPIDAIKNNIQWNTASPDLFTYWIDNGLYGFYGPQPNIHIDGIPVDANFFGWQNLNLLPISTTGDTKSGLDPQVFNGHWSPAGYVNFSDDTLDSGLSIDASYYVGNETGDPGPYVYDDSKASPNIDRWGPDGEFTLRYKTGNWYSKGRFVFRNHLPTDLISNARLHFTASLLGTNQQYVNHRVYENTRSGLFETGYDSESLKLRGRLTLGTSKDYIFLQPLGREVPAETGFKQVAVDADYSLGSITLNGRYIGHQKTINKRINLHPYIFDWDQRKHSFSLSATYNNDAYELKPGITYDRLKTFAPGVQKKYSDLILFYLKGALPITEQSSLKGEISADYDEQQTAKSYRFSLPTTVSQYWSIKPKIQSVQTLPLRQHSFSYWVNRGYTFADELGISYGSNTNVEMNELTIFSLRNTFSFSPDISLKLEQQLTEHRNLNIPFQQVDPNEFITDTQPGSFTINREEGSRLQLSATAIHIFSDLFTQSLSVHLQRTLSGSEEYENYFKQVPETKAEYKLDVRPAPDLLLSLEVFYQSSTTWNEFKAIQGNNYRLPGGIPIPNVSGTFDIITPAYTDISLGLQKWFLNDRLSMQFSLDNILNNELRMHPLGADLNTKFDVNIRLHL